MINIAAATPADLEGVLQLDERSFPAGERWGHSAWSAELDGDHRVILAARETAGESLAGVVAVTMSGTTADLLRVVVDPARRRQGIARQLVDAALDAVRDAGVRSVMLEVRYDNEPAIALYQSVGFEQLGVRNNYYGPGLDALVLKIYDLSPDLAEPGIGRHHTMGADG